MITKFERVSFDGLTLWATANGNNYTRRIREENGKFIIEGGPANTSYKTLGETTDPLKARDALYLMALGKSDAAALNRYGFESDIDITDDDISAAIQSSLSDLVDEGKRTDLDSADLRIDLGLDSLDLQELELSIESELGTDLEEDTCIGSKTIGDLKSAIAKQISLAKASKDTN